MDLDLIWVRPLRAKLFKWVLISQGKSNGPSILAKSVNRLGRSRDPPSNLGSS